MDEEEQRSYRDGGLNMTQLFAITQTKITLDGSNAVIEMIIMAAFVIGFTLTFLMRRR